MKKDKKRTSEYYNSFPDLTDFSVASATDTTGFIPSAVDSQGALEAYLLMKSYRADSEKNYPDEDSRDALK